MDDKDLLNFIDLNCVLPNFTRFYWISNGFYRVLLGFTQLGYYGLHFVFSGFTEFYRVLLGFTGSKRVLPGVTGFYYIYLGFYWVYQILL